MLQFRRPHGIISGVLALAMSFFARAESPSGDDPPLPSLFQADKKYPLEQLSREMYLLDPNPGITPGDMTQTLQTPSERLEGLRAIWQNVNVWSDAAPLLT